MRPSGLGAVLPIAAASLPASAGQGTWEAAFAPDGRSMVVRTALGDNDGDLWRVRLDSNGVFIPLLHDPARESRARLA